MNRYVQKLNKGDVMEELTERERELIELAKQEFMLMLPDVIGNLMANQAAYARMNSDFYKKHPEYLAHKETVARVLEQVDGADTLAEYEKKLEKAIPLIEERVRMMQGMDVSKVSNKLDRKIAMIDTNSNGVI